MKISALTCATTLVVVCVVTALCWPQAAYAQTPISTCDTPSGTAQVTAPGSYVLTANLAATGGNCILVAADDVTIDLAGFTISAATSSARGIWDGATPRNNVTLLNGTVSGFNIAGIEFPTTTSADIQAVNVINNNGTASAVGVYLGDASTVSDSYVVGNAHRGVIVGENSVVAQNTVLSNGAFGIDLGPNSRAEGNLVEDNGAGGIGMFPGSIATGNIVNNNGYATAPGNPGDGIAGDDNTHAEDNVANNNAAHGITLGAGCTVTGNTTDGNGFNGIFVAGAGSTVSGNTAYGNGRDGIRVNTGGASVSNNTTSGNSENGITLNDYPTGVTTAASFTSNTASDNGHYGIEVWCPSNVIGNTMSNNAWSDIYVAGGNPNQCYFQDNLPKKN